MTEAQRLTMLKGLLDISGTSDDTSLTALLQFAMREAIVWKFGYSTNPPVARVSNEYAILRLGAFLGAISPTTGTSYTFTYSESAESWQYGGEDIELEDYGIEYDETVTPDDAETIVVKYNEAQMSEYDTVIVQACVAGYNLKGIENQTGHLENGINRQIKYTDVTEYLHAHIPAYCGVK